MEEREKIKPEALAGKFAVKIRRSITRAVRVESEQVDGRTYYFIPGWLMDEGDPYPGEWAMIPRDPSYPLSAPAWIAMGDLFLTPAA